MSDILLHLAPHIAASLLYAALGFHFWHTRWHGSGKPLAPLPMQQWERAAIAATLVVGSLLFWALGKPVVESFHVFFIQPMETSYGWSELLIKACPLILIAEGLAIGFKARIYNIGAEGQLIIGALFGGGVAIYMDGSDSAWVIPAMVVAGAIGGALCHPLLQRRAIRQRLRLQ